MPQLVKKLQNNRRIIFDTGKFDDWCVYMVENNGHKMAPRDETYFYELSLISKKYDQNKVYDDFITIYNKTTNRLDKSVLTVIDTICATYRPQHQIIMEQWMTVLYAGMVAEENKKHARLKKRIKRLGIYQVLVLNMSPKDAAQFSYGKKWQELDKIMVLLDF